jgi:hypothetical protein
MKFEYVLTLLASAFAIVTATDSVSTDKLDYHVGEDIEVSFRVQHPDHRDWVAIYEADADLHNLGRTLLWLYTCGDQHCSAAVSSDTLTFGSGDPEEGSRAHFPLPAGHYKAVLARGSHIPYEALAVSHVFSISTSPTVAVSVNQGCYHVGEDIRASFRDQNPHPQDWVAIYEGDADLHDLESRPLLWLYTCGDQHCSFSVSSGTLTFGSGHPDESSRGCFPLPAGHYKAILARNEHLPYEALAVSYVFSINTSSHPCP